MDLPGRCTRAAAPCEGRAGSLQGVLKRLQAGLRPLSRKFLFGLWCVFPDWGVLGAFSRWVSRWRSCC